MPEPSVHDDLVAVLRAHGNGTGPAPHRPASAQAADRLDAYQSIVHRLAIDRPFGVTPKVGSLYCTLCGAIEGAGDEHQTTCTWRLAREAEGLDTGWPRCAPGCTACAEGTDHG